MKRPSPLVRAILGEAVDSAVPTAEAKKVLGKFQAFYGFNSEGQPRICGWCPDKDAAGQAVAELGLVATHGICQPHHKEQLAQIRRL